MAQVRRETVMKITRPHAKIEKVTNTRKMSPTTVPSSSVTIFATGVAEEVNFAMSCDARLSATRNTKPTIPLKNTENHMAVGTARWASCVSSARLAAASKPTIVKAPSKNASIKGPEGGQDPRANHGEGAVPVLKRGPGCSIPRTAPTITHNKV